MAKRAVTIEDLFKFHWLQGAALAPDGRVAVYAVSTITQEGTSEEERVTLYRVDVQVGVTRQLTSGKCRDSEPTFSPSGTLLAFTSTRTGKPQIYLMHMDGGEALPLTRLSQGASGPVWSPDGAFIAFTAGVVGSTTAIADRLAQPYRITRRVWRWDELGDIDRGLRHIYVVDVRTQRVTQLTNGLTVDADPKWSPDSRRILFNATMNPEFFDSGYYGSVRVVDMKGRVDCLVDRWETYDNAWLPNGNAVAITGNSVTGALGTHADLHVLNLENKELENRTPSLERAIQGWLEGRAPTLSLHQSHALPVTSDGKWAYARVQNGGRMQICRIALDGKECVEVVVDGDRCCTLLDMRGDMLLFSADDISHAPDLYIASSEGSEEKRLSRLNDELMAEFQSSHHTRVTSKGADGKPVEGWYVEPTDGSKAPYPSILWIHGGPYLAQGYTFAFDTLLLNSAGFGVMFFNYRGSHGYGNSFVTDTLGGFGGLDCADLIAGVDAAAVMGLADPEKLGVCGISFGGTMTCFLAAKTRRFKAAVPQNSVTDWQSFYGTSDIGVVYTVKALGGHPHEVPDTYRRCSPVTYAHQCKTPTLLIQGEEDWRCPPNQSEQFYTALRAAGCIAEMQRQPGAAHLGAVSGPLPVRKAHLKSTLEWFTKYISEQ